MYNDFFQEFYSSYFKSSSAADATSKENMLDYGAVGVITDSQIIFELNGKNGTSTHWNKLVDIMKRAFNDDTPNNNKGITLKHFYDLKRNANLIEFRLVNESAGTYFLIFMPSSGIITSNQAKLFEQFTNEHSDTLMQISQSLDPQNGLIYYMNEVNEQVSTHDLNDALAFVNSIVSPNYSTLLPETIIGEPLKKPRFK